VGIVVTGLGGVAEAIATAHRAGRAVGVEVTLDGIFVALAIRGTDGATGALPVVSTGGDFLTQPVSPAEIARVAVGTIAAARHFFTHAIAATKITRCAIRVGVASRQLFADTVVAAEEARCTVRVAPAPRNLFTDPVGAALIPIGTIRIGAASGNLFTNPISAAEIAGGAVRVGTAPRAGFTQPVGSTEETRGAIGVGDAPLDCFALEVTVTEFASTTLVVSPTIGYRPTAAVQTKGNVIAFRVDGTAPRIDAFALFTEDDGATFDITETALLDEALAIAATELTVGTLRIEQASGGRVDVTSGVIEVIPMDIATGQCKESEQGQVGHRAHSEC
jgi:hypothetical protein